MVFARFSKSDLQKSEIFNLTAIYGGMLKAVIKRSGTTYQEAVSEEYATDDSICGNYFTTITEWDDTTAYYKIAYAKDTKVKYLIIVSGYKFGITPLYDADGTLQVYEE